MNRTPYRRLVQYYETDRMGIVHHSNYIRWFEEARTDFLRNNGIVYSDLEQSGVMIPVVNVSCRFRTPARYDEWIEITTTPTAYNGARLDFSYEVRNASGKLLATGTSEHCFMDAQRWVPINMKRKQPEQHARMAALLEKAGGMI